MSIFNQIFDAAKTTNGLEHYVYTHIEEINDFYYSPYDCIKNEIDSVDNFILRKRKILGSISFEEIYSRSFILILLDLCTRFNLLSATSTIHRIMINHNIPCNKRMTAALAYIDPKPATNDEYIIRFTNICESLELAIQEEEDNDIKSIVTFLNYWGTVVQDTNNEYIRRLKEIIDSSIHYGSYQFINNSAIVSAINVDTSDQEKATFEIQSIIDNLLLNTNIALRTIRKDAPYLIEDGTDYAKEVLNIGPNFSRIRKISVDRCNGSAITDRGVAILENEVELFEYMKRFGNMHKAKLESALRYPFPQEWEQAINLYDWGSGQGIASMVFLEKFPTAIVNRVTLIEPSDIAISRAALHISIYRPDTQIRTICKKLDDLYPKDFNINGANVHIHLFSNILDIDDYSFKHLYTLIDLCFPGVNYFVCTSPYVDDIKAGRLDLFMCHFQNTYDTFKIISQATNRKIDGAIFWCCNKFYNGSPCDEHEARAKSCLNRWSRITRVFLIKK